MIAVATLNTSIDSHYFYYTPVPPSAYYYWTVYRNRAVPSVCPSVLFGSICPEWKVIESTNLDEIYRLPFVIDNPILGQKGQRSRSHGPSKFSNGRRDAVLPTSLHPRCWQRILIVWPEFLQHSYTAKLLVFPKCVRAHGYRCAEYWPIGGDAQLLCCAVQYTGSVLWNRIPETLQVPMSKYIFRHKLKLHLSNELHG